MLRHRWIVLLLIPLLAGACESNPVAHEDALVAELALSSGQAHTLSPLGFTVTVRNEHGATVTNFDTLRVERLAEGTSTWQTAADLTPGGHAFMGEYTFMSSGAYELRVVAMRTGHADFEEIPLLEGGMTKHVEVGRTHENVAGYRVEFENFPGHVHQGDEVALRFWVFTAEADADGNRTPITDLQGTIHCVESTASTESHTPSIVEDGVYEAHHTWVAAGAGHAKLHFTVDGETAEVSFPVHVAHNH